MAANKKLRKKKVPSKKRTSNPLSNVSEILPPGHRFDYELSNIAFLVLTIGYMASILENKSAEKTMRMELKRRLASGKMSKVARKHYQSVIDLADRQPLSVIVMKILEVKWSEYLIVNKHMLKFSNETFLNRFSNFIESAKKSGWEVNLIDGGCQEVFSPDKSYLIVDEDYKGKFFNEAGRMTNSFYVAARSMTNIHEITEMAYQSGLITYKGEVDNGLYSLMLYPDNNVPGIPFTPPSVTAITLKD